VLSVLFQIYYVVDEVDGAGDQAEEDEGEGDAGESMGQEELSIEDEAGVDHRILGPLLGTHADEKMS
jgi:hypothetical protein